MISGHALDPKGRKMSKSLGNAIDPVEMVEKYSADMLRYWAAAGSLGDDLPFQEKEFISGKKFLTKVFNASRFVAMKTEGITPEDFGEIKDKLRKVDKWILSRFSRVKKEATESFDVYEYSKSLSAVRNFFWLEFADFYIEMVKHRVYDEKNSESGRVAKVVLVKIITEILKLLAPFVPHLAEEIFQSNFKGIAKEKSIHLEKWPSLDEGLVNEEAEKSGAIAKEVIAAIRKHKSYNNLAMNAELTSVKVKLKDVKLFEKIAEDIKATMKVKEIKAEKTDSEEIKIKVS